MTSLGRGVRCPECGTECAAWSKQKLFRVPTYGPRMRAAWYAYTTGVIGAASVLYGSMLVTLVVTSSGGRLRGRRADVVTKAAEAGERMALVLILLGLGGFVWVLAVPRWRRPALGWQAPVILVSLFVLSLFPSIGY